MNVEDAHNLLDYGSCLNEGDAVFPLEGPDAHKHKHRLVHGKVCIDEWLVCLDAGRHVCGHT